MQYDIDSSIKSSHWNRLNCVELLSLADYTVKYVLNFMYLQNNNNQEIEETESIIMISVDLIDDENIRKFNLQYRNKDHPTNVLSFSYYHDIDILNVEFISKNPIIQLGDIMLSFETIIKESDMYNIPFKDYFSYMLIHATLHILGMDHQNEQDRMNMESIEKNIMNDMGIISPY